MDIQVRNAIVERFLYLVPPIARSLARSQHSRFGFDDLHQEGCRGLLGAAENFDEAAEATFPAYASLRIRGAMLDAVRAEYSNQSYSTADGNQFCGSIDLSEQIASSDATPEQRLLRKENASAVSRVVSRLGARDREIISLRFGRGLTHERTGAQLGISGTRVHQLESRVKRTLFRNQELAAAA